MKLFSQGALSTVLLVVGLGLASAAWMIEPGVLRPVLAVAGVVVLGGALAGLSNLGSVLGLVREAYQQEAAVKK